MQTTSATWKSLYAAGAPLEVKATINGTDYTDISDPVVDRALMQSGLTIGNVVSATCRFSIRDPGAIPKSAEVVISMRFNDGETASEWLPAGTFYISKRQRDPVTGVLALECYDALLKANGEYATSGAYPKSMSDTVDEIAAAIGVDVDARTVINGGAGYTIGLPDAGTAMNKILQDIAAVHGGNWHITPANKLRLVPVISSAGASSAQTDAIDVDGIIGSIVIDSTSAVTGLRVVTDEGDVMYGGDDGVIVKVDSLYVDDSNLSDLQNALIGQTYQHYTLTSSVYDPAAELGDYVRAGANGEIKSVLYGETITLGLAPRGNITALKPAEIADEYPYIGQGEQNQRSIRRLTTVIADVVEAVDARFDNLDASDIKTGLIHSADYAVVVIQKVYPSATIYPSSTTYPNNGERVISGFAIDFRTGQIYGGLYSQEIAQIKNRPLYPIST